MRSQKRFVTSCALVLAVLVMVATPATGLGKETERSDADVVLVFPAIDHKTLSAEWRAVHDFVRALRAQHLTVARVAIGAILHGRAASSLRAEDVRGYLRAHFTWRASTLERPRYLGILASPNEQYRGSPSRVPTVPRFHVFVAGGQAGPAGFDTDVPYEFLPPTTIDGGDGSVDPGDLNPASPTFDVFRVPINAPSDLRIFSQRHIEFARAPYRNDATLVAGLFGGFGIPGDTSFVQCLNASDLVAQHLATRVLKVLDSTAACPPDVFTQPAGPHLSDVLADPHGDFRGGTIVDISHGDPSTIYGQTPAGTFFSNLAVGDVARIPNARLNVFISIACDNDGPGPQPNLAAAMFSHNSVAVISATTTVVPLDLAAVLFAEHDSVVRLFQQDQNLLQQLHAFRADYFRQFAANNPVNWTNLLTVNLIGDGLLTVAH